MKITRQGTTVLDHDEIKNSIKLKDLRPGDIFRFANGHEKNIYMKKAGTYVQLSTGTEFEDGYLHTTKSNAAVIFYPNAVLELGAEMRHYVEVTPSIPPAAPISEDL